MRLITVLRATAVLAAIVWTANAIGGEELIVEQRDKNFLFKGAKVESMKVKVGDVIQFKNMDPFFHNVFSLSDVKMFDLGSFPQGQMKAVTFDKPGKVEVECAIHPQMHLVVEVR